MSILTATHTDPGSYVLPPTVTSNIPAAAGPRERGIFANARGLLLESATLLGGRPVRLHLQDNRGTYVDGQVTLTAYATIALDPAPGTVAPVGRVLLTLTWDLGGRRAERRGWALTMDRYRDAEGGRPVDTRHVGSADGKLPHPEELALLVAEAAA